MVNHLNKGAKTTQRGEKAFSTVLDPLDVLIGRKTCPLSHTTHTHTQNSNRLCINVSSKTMKLLQGNTGDSLSLGAGKDFLEHRKHEIILKIDQLDFVAIKNFSY